MSSYGKSKRHASYSEFHSPAKLRPIKQVIRERLFRVLVPCTTLE